MHGIPYVNGVQHSWADIVISIAGVPFTGVRAIKYGESRVIDNIYGIGAYPVGRGYGNIEATASITLLMSDVLALSDA
ncbi:MAG: hypothetical protein LBH19_11220, partial [Dysgonamonadaceae bacterium]|nr:hypothetical protein [Dysgonamonadaceae bacterium]